MFNLNYGTNEPIYKTEIDSHIWRTDLCLSRRWGGSGLDWESGVNRCKLFYLDWISNGIMLYSPGTVSNLLGYKMMEDDMRKKNV